MRTMPIGPTNSVTIINVALILFIRLSFLVGPYELTDSSGRTDKVKAVQRQPNLLLPPDCSKDIRKVVAPHSRSFSSIESLPLGVDRQIANLCAGNSNHNTMRRT